MAATTRPEWVETLDDWHLLTTSKVLAVLLIAIILTWVTRRVIRRVVLGMHSLRTNIPGGTPQDMRSERRARTLTGVLRSTAAAVIWTIAVIAILSDLGVNVSAFIAGASIIGAALAFGAQQVVRDLMAGFFMFTEDQYGIGDNVDLGLAQGTVEEVSLRVTRLRDADGRVWYVPHGQITRVANMSQEWAQAVVDVAVARDADLADATATIEDAAREISADRGLRNDILDAPRVLGVQEVADDRVVLRVTVKVKPGARLEIQRALRARFVDEMRAGRLEAPPPPAMPPPLTAPPATA